MRDSNGPGLFMQQNGKGVRMKMRFLLAALLLATTAAHAEPVAITPDLMSVTVPTPDGPVEISRVQDNDAVIEGEFARIAPRR